MERKKLFVFRAALVLFLLEGAFCMLTSLKAEISMSSIMGRVTFSKLTNNINVTFNLNGLTPGSSYSWSVKKFPVNYDTADRCTDEAIGESLSPLINGESVQDNTPSVVEMADLIGLLGRSIVVMEGGVIVACATILPDAPLTTAMVNFHSFIGGTILIRQPMDSESAESLVYTDLFTMYKIPDVMEYNWEIRVNPVDESKLVQNRCNDLGNVFGESPSENCNKQNQTSCSIGSLESKLGPVKVAPGKGTSRSLYVDGNLPLFGSNNVIGKSMVILATNGSILACGTINAYKEKTVSAVFNNDGVTGKINFSQKSPFDPTMVEIMLSGLNEIAGGYHVHDFPVPSRMDVDSSICGNDAVSGHWNPFSIVKTTSPAAGTGTSDQYEVGDLSGKYGTFNDQKESFSNFTDWNLPLFGMNSIIGRSIVIHRKDTTGSRWICTNIGYPSKVLTGVAVFKHPVIGQMTFRQAQDDPFSDTSIYIELNRADGLQETNYHNYHVHLNPIEHDLDVKESCGKAAGHYNPFDVNVSADHDYPSLCSPTSALRCELGDLSRKHQKLNITASKTKTNQYFFTDSSLPLSGQFSIMKRSVVIHAAEGGDPRIACANIYEQTPMEAVVNSWSSGPVSGSIKFSQATSVDKTKVEVELNGLGEIAGGYHVHVLPVMPGAASPCSAESVAGHFDPFNITNTITSPAAGNGTYDKYEIGDLSGKYGLLTDLASFSDTFMDNNLPLRGRQSIVGRSVVIHKAEENARWICGNIQELLPEQPVAYIYKAQAVFTGDIQGSIMLSQVHYADGSLGDTQVYINLKHAVLSITRGHPWHIHEDPISLGGDCSTANAHYNPYAVNVDNNYDECHPMNPLRCEMGDLAGKHGKYDIGTGPKFYTDVNLPLTGKYSVLGRSIVIHAPGNARLACADIMSMGAEVVEMVITNPRPSFDKKDFMAAMANLLNSPHWKIGVMVPEDELKGISDDCLKVSTYMTGPDRMAYKIKLEKYIDEEPGLLGIYAPCLATASSLSMSLAVLFFLLSVNWISR